MVGGVARIKVCDLATSRALITSSCSSSSGWLTTTAGPWATEINNPDLRGTTYYWGIVQRRGDVSILYGPWSFTTEE